jgi:ActR/RegA family two-component response regulator
LPLAKDINNYNAVFSENKKYTLLLLEDDSLYRTVVKEMVIKDKALSNVKIVEAGSVKEAIKITEKQVVDYALVDFDLGDDEIGLDYLDYVNKKKINVTCALHTNKYVDIDIKNKLNKYGVAYISKPLDVNKLYTFINKR